MNSKLNDLCTTCYMVRRGTSRSSLRYSMEMMLTRSVWSWDSSESCLIINVIAAVDQRLYWLHDVINKVSGQQQLLRWLLDSFHSSLKITPTSLFTSASDQQQCYYSGSSDVIRSVHIAVSELSWSHLISFKLTWTALSAVLSSSVQSVRCKDPCTRLYTDRIDW